MDDVCNLKLEHWVVSYTYKYKATEKIYFKQLMHKISYEFCSNEEKK